ncbi:helix-turn-helix domain-containing protein [Streptomyces sp. NPDC007369]|uniref:helix-turn-helix domain-containing protein n=1 Tax=Streptomyces sp. NPDC007369 TaxID=3154589 RepID=UPI0033EA8E6D
MKVVLDAASLPDAERIASWQRALARWLAPVRVTAPEGQPAGGTLATAHLGYLRVLSVNAGPLRISRDPRLVAGAPLDRLAVAVQGGGRAALSQNGRSAELRPGDLAVIDLRVPFRLEQREPFGLRLFRLPSQAVGASRARLEKLTGRAVTPSGGVAALVVPYLETLARTAGRVAPDVGDLLAGSTAELLVTLAQELGGGGPRRDPARGHVVAAVRAYVDEHLGDPGLSPRTIAAAHRISLRYLHRLFEDEGVTVGRLIRQRRVEECARELAGRGRTGPAVAAVAGRWGFVNPGHFSRAFKAVYGVPPREWAASGAVPHGGAGGGLPAGAPAGASGGAAVR